MYCPVGVRASHKCWPLLELSWPWSSAHDLLLVQDRHSICEWDDAEGDSPEYSGQVPESNNKTIAVAGNTYARSLTVLNADVGHSRAFYAGEFDADSINVYHAFEIQDAKFLLVGYMNIGLESQLLALFKIRDPDATDEPGDFVSYAWGRHTGWDGSGPTPTCFGDRLVWQVSPDLLVILVMMEDGPAGDVMLPMHQGDGGNSGIITAMPWSTSGSHFAAVQRQLEGASLHVWDTETWEKLRSITFTPPERMPDQVIVWAPAQPSLVLNTATCFQVMMPCCLRRMR